MFTLTYSPAALKGIKRHLTTEEAAALTAKLTAFAADPFDQHPAATRLKGSAMWRVRQGDYRAIVDVDTTAKTVTVREFDHRSRVYR